MEKTINVITPGSLSNLLTHTEKLSITKLKVTGNIDARDFRCMRDELPLLNDLDLFQTTVKAYNGTGGTYYLVETYPYLDNEIPIQCFVRVNMTSGIDIRRSESLLTRLILPNTITYIADSAFTYHSGLKEIIIPDSVIKIGVGSFEKCTGLEFISIGKNVIELGNQSFMNCNHLNTILCKPIIPPIALSTTFYGSYTNTSTYNCPIVYVPDQSIDLYNIADGFFYYHSYIHPQTNKYIIGIKGLSTYQGNYPVLPGGSLGTSGTGGTSGTIESSSGSGGTSGTSGSSGRKKTLFTNRSSNNKIITIRYF